MMKNLKTIALTFCMISLFVSGAHASTLCESAGTQLGAVSTVASQITTSTVNSHTTQEFQAHRIWMISIFWEDNLLPAMMLMSEQLTAAAMKQAEIIGGFMDAKHQMETQQVLQKIRARTHKDYHPSTGMCEFGSSVKSLAASERLGEINAIALAQRSQDRALGNANTVGSGGITGDISSRLKQFRETYCNPIDNNGGLLFLCEHDQDGNPKNSAGSIGGQDPSRLNKDIDYVATLESPWTLDVNFTQTESDDPTPAEEDVLALAANLYGNEVFFRPGASLFKPIINEEGIEVVSNTQLAYMDARAVLAKQSVAENSYNAIVGMKSAGTAGSRDYLQGLLKELGIDDTNANVNISGENKTELDTLLGDDPSYYAQMDVLTKNIYQNTDFYTNLYDKPANVERKGVALQAIGLMQKFDLLKSYLRNEATMSILLELAVIDLQREIENQMSETRPGGETGGQ